jgi:peroxiredoxin
MGWNSAAFAAKAELKVGAAAPDFTAQGQDGKTYSLKDQKGKIVVLEWFNDDCPYIQKHYGSGHMQNLQKTYTGKGVVWWTVASNAKGKEGHLERADAIKVIKERKSYQSALLIDDNSKVASLYGAQTTPHMFIINTEGKLAYQGAIDDRPSARKSSLEGAHNYVTAALDSLLKGEKVETATTQPYGCSVKYP